jgi:hypothetical protein
LPISYDLEKDLGSKRDGDTKPRALVDVGQCLWKTEDKSIFFGHTRAVISIGEQKANYQV